MNFPRNFYWGAATSSHQVEGGNHNDWTEWEKSESRIKNLESSIRDGEFRKKFPHHLWDKWPTPDDIENYISGRSSDHYNRFHEDFDIAKLFGHNAHRFSIEWSRIEPEEGKFDQEAIEHYRETVKALRERGMEPFVTLWHFTLPLWVKDLGGWENPRTINYFVRYCEKVAMEFQKDITFLITMNEPVLWASNAYRTGNFPPQKKNYWAFYKVFWNLHSAHARSYRVLKKINPSFQIGLTQNTGYFDSNLLRPVYYFLNFFFLSTIKSESDYIGIDYYRRIPFLRKSKANSDIGWETYPQGLYCVLKGTWRKFKKPIFVLENGIADAEDHYRPEFIRKHIEAVAQSIKEGVDIRGYFYWSLLDNFEWEKGFWPRFGLVEVDYRTQERRIRESAKVYAEIIKNSKS